MGVEGERENPSLFAIGWALCTRRGCQLVPPGVFPYTYTVLLNLLANISKTR